MYMKPSSTSGVPSSASLPDEPPSATANSSRMPLTFDLLISASGEKRCAPKSWWFISQFCGSLSGLVSRSKVTSAARAEVVASSRQDSAVRSLADFTFIVRLPFCVVPAKAGTHIPESGAYGSAFAGTTPELDHHSPNTYSTVEFDWLRRSGVRLTVPSEFVD